MKSIMLKSNLFQLFEKEKIDYVLYSFQLSSIEYMIIIHMEL